MNAVIYTPPGHQHEGHLCIAHCATHGYTVDSVTTNPEQALHMLADGVVDVVVVAYRDDLEHLTAHRVEVVRADHTGTSPRTSRIIRG